MVEIVDGIGIIGYWSMNNPFPSHNSGANGRSSGFYSYGYNRSGHMYHTRTFFAYYHRGLNISQPRFPQEAIPRGLHG